MSPASSTALIGARRRLSAAWKRSPVSAGSKGSAPSLASSLAAGAASSAAEHGAEAPRVGQAQHTARGDEVEVVVFAGRARPVAEGQRPRHPQVHQQPTGRAAGL
jgi:hypothetical protein